MPSQPAHPSPDHIPVFPSSLVLRCSPGIGAHLVPPPLSIRPLTEVILRRITSMTGSLPSLPFQVFTALLTELEITSTYTARRVTPNTVGMFDATQSKEGICQRSALRLHVPSVHIPQDILCHFRHYSVNWKCPPATCSKCSHCARLATWIPTLNAIGSVRRVALDIAGPACSNIHSPTGVPSIHTSTAISSLLQNQYNHLHSYRDEMARCLPCIGL